MKQFVRFAVAVGVGLLCVSCSSARVVETMPGRGGSIALPSRTSSGARNQATQMMAENCPGGAFEIIREGEAIVGARTSGPVAASRITRGNVGVSVGSAGTTRQETEWRLDYRCSSIVAE